MPTTRTRSSSDRLRWSVLIAAGFVLAVGADVIASVPRADAQPPGTLCGHIQNSMGTFLPVIVLSGNPDCFTAVHVAQDYLTGPRPVDGGTLQLQNVRGWKCYAPLLPGRSHADSYLECDGDGGAIKMGN
jgi:hypothetical protein